MRALYRSPDEEDCITVIYFRAAASGSIRFYSPRFKKKSPEATWSMLVVKKQAADSLCETQDSKCTKHSLFSSSQSCHSSTCIFYYHEMVALVNVLLFQIKALLTTYLASQLRKGRKRN